VHSAEAVPGLGLLAETSQRLEFLETIAFWCGPAHGDRGGTMMLWPSVGACGWNRIGTIGMTLLLLVVVVIKVLFSNLTSVGKVC